MQFAKRLILQTEDINYQGGRYSIFGYLKVIIFRNILLWFLNW